jgi:hypothetical protein
MAKILDAEILGAALIGYQERLRQIEARMAELHRRVNGKTAMPRQVAAEPTPKKRTFSPEGRAHIVAAQKKRWAAVRKAKAAATAPGAKPIARSAVNRAVRKSTAKRAKRAPYNRAAVTKPRAKTVSTLPAVETPAPSATE